jgi:hypothetical protein
LVAHLAAELGEYEPASRVDDGGEAKSAAGAVLCTNTAL